MRSRVLLERGLSADDIIHRAATVNGQEGWEFGSILTTAVQMVLQDYDTSKPMFLQKVAHPDFFKTYSETIRNHIGVMDEEVQISEALCKLADTAYDLSYVLAHENDSIGELGIDIETYSDVNIKDCGLYRYVDDESFEILLFAYSVNGGPTQQVDLAMGETIPQKIVDALYAPNVLKTAHNAAFERVCLSKHFGKPIPVEQWDCTMVRCARMGFPLSLAGAGEALGLKQQKMTEGKALIRYFSCPCKPTKTNGMRTRNMPEDAPEKWALYKKYNKVDVDVEQAIRRKVTRLDYAEWDQRLWFLDQHINDRGVMLDKQLAEHAERMDQEYKAQLAEEAMELTGLSNPNSIAQLKAWLEKETGTTIKSMNKTELPNIVATAQSDKARRLLAIRAEMGKTSTKKYTSMLRCVCDDGRIHGITQFCGAARTGRWAGRLVQLQNLPQNHLKDLDDARNMVKAGDLDDLEMCYGNVPSVLSELIRTAFVAKPGCTFHVCDFSAIEARVLAWVAGEKWVLDVFRNGGDIYCETAGKMFHCKVEKHGENSHLRPKGKISVLALGYQGGVGALEAMDKSNSLRPEEKKAIVGQWRDANPKIVRFWHNVEKATRTALETDEAINLPRGLTFKRRWGGLLVTLPSGRSIYYPRMRVEEKGFSYEGQNQTTGKWERKETYGGKLTENIVQAIARDLLGHTMLWLDEAGFEIVFHVHDEAIIEAHEGQTLQQIEEIFARVPDWAQGLPLKGAGYSTPYYLKD